MKSIAQYLREELTARVRPGREETAVVVHRVAVAGDFRGGDPVVLTLPGGSGSPPVRIGRYRQVRYGKCCYA